VFMKALCQFIVYPKHLFSDLTNPLEFENHAYWKAPVGSGSYKFDSANYPDFVMLTRWDDYYGEKAAIKNVKFQSYATGGADAAAAAMIAGVLDQAAGNEFNDINFAKNIVDKNPDYAYGVVDSLYTRSFWFNQAGSQDGKQHPGNTNPRVRQAIAMLIDREGVASFYAGQATAMTTLVNPDSPDYNTDIPLFRRDIEGARKILEEEGFDFNHTLRLTTHYADQTTAVIMDYVIQNLADAGVKAEFILATGDLVEAFYTLRNYDMCYGAVPWSTFIEQFNIVKPGFGIYEEFHGEASYADRQRLFGDLIAEYMNITNPVRHREILWELQANQIEYGVPIPLYSLNKVFTYNASKWSFDERYLQTNELALQNFSDLGVQYWKLLKP